MWRFRSNVPHNSRFVCSLKNKNQSRLAQLPGVYRSTWSFFNRILAPGRGGALCPRCESTGWSGGEIYKETSPLWSHTRLLFRMLSPAVGSSGFLHLFELLLCVVLRLRVVEELFNQCTFALCTRQIAPGRLAEGRLRWQHCPDLFQERNEVVSLSSAVVSRTAKYFGNPLIPLPSPWSFR